MNMHDQAKTDIKNAIRSSRVMHGVMASIFPSLYGNQNVDSKRHTDCDFCDGTGEVEEEIGYRDDSGHYHIEGTGKFKKCFNCQDYE